MVHLTLNAANNTNAHFERNAYTASLSLSWHDNDYPSLLYWLAYTFSSTSSYHVRNDTHRKFLHSHNTYKKNKTYRLYSLQSHCID